jgi:hypothetical protein
LDFYIDIGFAVLLRILKNKKDREKYISAFHKLYNAIGAAFEFEAPQPTKE